MKNLLAQISRYPKVILAGILALAAGIRFAGLGAIPERIFDEVYFPVMSQGFVNGQFVYDAHPALGKLLMMPGLLLFGDTPLGWRVMTALFGVALVGALAWLAFLLTKSWRATLIVALLAAIDGFLVLYSRVGLMDGLMILFMVMSLATALHEDTIQRRWWIPFFFLGCAIAVKWMAASIIVPLIYVLLRDRRGYLIFPGLVSAGAVYLAIMVGLYIALGDPRPWTAMVDWHRGAFGYHLGLKETHSWSSRWFTWPLIIRPLLMYYQGGDAIQVLTTVGNPLLSWLGAAGVISWFMLLVTRSVRQLKIASAMWILLFWYGAALLPWAFIGRVLFHYHYLPSYVASLLVVGCTIGLAKSRWKIPAYTALALLLAVGLYMLPFATAHPLSSVALHDHVWFSSWLYGLPQGWEQWVP